MNEREQAIVIANNWLDFKMNTFVQMVHGDPDCDACVLARQYIRAIEQVAILEAELRVAYKLPGEINRRLGDQDA